MFSTFMPQSSSLTDLEAEHCSQLDERKGQLQMFFYFIGQK